MLTALWSFCSVDHLKLMKDIDTCDALWVYRERCSSGASSLCVWWTLKVAKNRDSLWLPHTLEMCYIGSKGGSCRTWEQSSVRFETALDALYTRWSYILHWSSLPQVVFLCFPFKTPGMEFDLVTQSPSSRHSSCPHLCWAISCQALHWSCAFSSCFLPQEQHREAWAGASQQPGCLTQLRSGGEAGENTKEGSSLSPEDHIIISSKVLKNYLNEKENYCKMPIRGNRLCGLLSTGY